MDASTQAKPCPVTELVHRVITTGVPHLTLVRRTERVHEVVARAIKLRAKDPLFCAEAAKFVLVAILNYDERRRVVGEPLYKSVH